MKLYMYIITLLLYTRITYVVFAAATTHDSCVGTVFAKEINFFETYQENRKQILYETVIEGLKSIRNR